ncbi:MAG: hypothetical protein Q9170_001407 [Blastenia crenularia]
MKMYSFDIVLPALAQTPAYLQQNDNALSHEQTPFQYSNQTSLSYIDWLRAHPQMHERFNTAMQGNRLGKPFWATWYPVQERLYGNYDVSCGLPFFVDVGGNIGHDLLRLRDQLESDGLDTSPLGHGKRMLVLQDLPGVLDSIPEETGRLLDDAGVRRENYDFYHPQPIKDEIRPAVGVAELGSCAPLLPP